MCVVYCIIDVTWFPRYVPKFCTKKKRKKIKKNVNHRVTNCVRSGGERAGHTHRGLIYKELAHTSPRYEGRDIRASNVQNAFSRYGVVHFVLALRKRNFLIRSIGVWCMYVYIYMRYIHAYIIQTSHTRTNCLRLES